MRIAKGLASFIAEGSANWSPRQVEAVYAVNFFEALAAAGQVSGAREVAAFAMEKGEAAETAEALRAAADRALGARAEALLATLALPSKPASPVKGDDSDPTPKARAEHSMAVDEDASAASGSENIVRMAKFVVDGQPRGIIPLGCFWRYNRITRAVTTMPLIFGPTPMSFHGVSASLKKEFAERMAPEKHGVRAGDWVVAIEGEPTLGMSNGHLHELYMEGDAGNFVTVVVKGHGEDMAIYREIVVKRISLKPSPVPGAK